MRTTDVRSPHGLVVGTLIGSAYLLLAPFPWQLGRSSLRMWLTLPELGYRWYILLAGAVPGFWITVRFHLRDTLVFIMFLLVLGVLYSVMFGNIGTVDRQRAQIMPWLFILAARGWELRRAKRPPQIGTADGALPLAVAVERREATSAR